MGLALQTPRPPLVTADEYLALDRESERKHEYIDGEIVAMSGGTRGHSVIAVNVAAELRAALRHGSCQVFNADMRVKAGNDYFYPDVSVACGRPAPESAYEDIEDIVTDPVVAVEVLSASTERYDRGRKFASYQRIPSLAHYVLVSQHEPRVEHFRRVTADADTPDAIDNQWLLQVLGPGQNLALQAVECRIAIDEIFFKVFDDAAEA